MFAGRIGALALFGLFLKAERTENILEEPQGRVIVG